MTDWRKVQGSQEEKPAEFDTVSSKVYVYQRRNVERISEETEQGTVEYWQYDERKMSRGEYAEMMTDKQASQIDYIAMMTDVVLEV